MAARNPIISICKAIGIILMVVGHAEGPDLLCRFLYTFHMPLFFIAAGYFFTQKNLDNPWEFCRKRVKGLYLPFLKWSLIYLVLHNVWHYFGILNEEYGSGDGGVTHPYTWHEAASRFLRIVFFMSGNDEFMAGAFWFFRGLLFASVVYLILHKLIEGKANMNGFQVSIFIMVLVLAFIAFRIANGLSIHGIAIGGLRETWGVFFFALGTVFRRYEGMFVRRWYLFALSFLFILGAAMLHAHGMSTYGEMIDLLTLPLTGFIGFLMTYWGAGYINVVGGRFKQLMCFIGDNTLYVLLWHIPAYKIVSLMKIHYYDLDFGQIGCNMVIHFNNKDFFWVIYSVVGVAIPLLAIFTWRKVRELRAGSTIKLNAGCSIVE